MLSSANHLFPKNENKNSNKLFIVFLTNLVALQFLVSLSGCTTSPSETSSASAAQLCQQGLPRACAKEYKTLSSTGEAAKAEQTYKSLCQMPRITCYNLKPEEPVSSESNLYEKLVEQDVWKSGRVTGRRIVLYRTVDVNPDHLKSKK